MKRSDFIKSILALIGVQIFPSPKLNETKNKIFLIKVDIAGLPYYQFEHCKINITKDKRLSIRREPLNEFDPKAVSIYCDDKKIGFIPKSKNQVVANLLDQGQKLEAFIYTKSKQSIKLYLIA